MKRFSARQRGAVALLTALMLVAVACGGDESEDEAKNSGGAATQPAAQSTPAAEEQLGPLTADELIQAAKEIGEGQKTGRISVDEAQALKCWKDNVCETGRGELTVAVADGFGENVWRQFTHMEFVLAALNHPKVKKIIYTTAHAKTPEAIANVQSMIAQKVDVLLMFADAGDALLPAVQQATRAGITVIPYVSPPGGEAPRDYPSLVAEDFCEVGRTGARRITQALGDNGGNVLLLGGTPGNNLSPAWQGCAKEELSKSPGVKILGPADTNWTQEGTLKAVSAALAQHQRVDAIQYEYANGALGAVRAFQQAGQSPGLFVLQTEDNGLFGEVVKRKDPKFQIAYTSGRNWSVRVAFEAAMALKGGRQIPTRITYPLPLIEFDASQYHSDLLGEYPETSLVPLSLVKKMFQ